MPGQAHPSVVLKLKTPCKVTHGQQRYRMGVVGNCHFLGDGDPQKARIGHQTSAQTWVVETWVPTNFVFEYRWVEFHRSTSFIFGIESIEPRRVEVGLRALEIRNKFNIPGGTFKEDIGHPVYFPSVCAPKRFLDSASLPARPRPRPPSRPSCRLGHATAAGEATPTSRVQMYRQAVSDQKHPQASVAKGETQQGAVSDGMVVERLNHTSTLASSSSSEDNASDNGSYSLSIAATAAQESVSTEVISSGSASSYSLTSMAESDIHMQTASSDCSYPSRSPSMELLPLSLPPSSGKYAPSVSFVARPCASTSAHSPSRRRLVSSVSAPDLGTRFQSSIKHNMETFDSKGHDLELTQGLGVLTVGELHNILRDNEAQSRQYFLTNGFNENLKTTYVPQKRNLHDILIYLLWLAIGAAIHNIWLQNYELNYS